MLGHALPPSQRPSHKFSIGQTLRTIKDSVGTVVATSFECGVWWYQLQDSFQHLEWLAEHHILGEVKAADPEALLSDMPLEELLGDCVAVDYERREVVFRSRESAVVFRRFNPEWTVKFERFMEAAVVHPVRKPAPRRRPGGGTYPQTGAFR